MGKDPAGFISHPKDHVLYPVGGGVTLKKYNDKVLCVVRISHFSKNTEGMNFKKANMVRRLWQQFSLAMMAVVKCKERG